MQWYLVRMKTRLFDYWSRHEKEKRREKGAIWSQFDHKNKIMIIFLKILKNNQKMEEENGKRRKRERRGRVRNQKAEKKCDIYIQLMKMRWCLRSYLGESTRSHQNSEVKHLWARLVEWWVTTFESRVLKTFLLLLFSCSFFSPLFSFFSFFFSSFYISFFPHDSNK